MPIKLVIDKTSPVVGFAADLATAMMRAKYDLLMKVMQMAVGPETAKMPFIWKETSFVRKAGEPMNTEHISVSGLELGRIFFDCEDVKNVRWVFEPARRDTDPMSNEIYQGPNDLADY